MNTRLLLLSFAFFAIAFGLVHDAAGNLVSEDETPALNADIIDYVNKQNTWTAHHNEYFKSMSLADAKRLLGAVMYGHSHRHRTVKELEVPTALPTSFDARTKWANCTTIGTILDQGRCGSCWAFGATESISDRFCITSNGAVNVSLSEMDLTCCDFNDGGCEGGDPYSAWSYVANAGIVTGACDPYTIPTCPPADQPCEPNTFVPTPQCEKSCSNGDTWHNDLHYVKSVYGVGPDPNQIATEIMNFGPVEAAFSVYEDFLTYKSGVYQHTTGGYLGGHAIKIIGWGVENSIPYWLVVNSWTTTWGDNGLFKIRRGDNQCGIESGVVAGTIRLS